MGKVFESVDQNDDYKKISEDVFYNENKDLLEEHYTNNEFQELDEKVKIKVSNELKLNFKFVLTFGTSITAFFPIIESFIINSGIDNIHIDKTTVVYLGICAIAISLEQPKESYRKLFSELRMRNVYALLKDLTKFIDFIKDIFNKVSSTIGKVIHDIVGMLNYTLLFVPFALTMASILSKEGITLSSIIESTTEYGIGKLMTISIGISGITLREFIVKLIKDLKSFSFNKVKKYLSKSFEDLQSKITTLLSKIKKVDTNSIDNELKKMEVDKGKSKSDDIILRYGQWKDNIERIDEEK